MDKYLHKKEQNHVSSRMDGFISEFFFYFKRGCRQGDPISPYIFILYAEILGKMIRNNDIRGIIIDIKEYKISQYADDTQLFLNESENSLREALDVLQKFYEMSGLLLALPKPPDGFLKPKKEYFIIFCGMEVQTELIELSSLKI